MRDDSRSRLFRWARLGAIIGLAAFVFVASVDWAQSMISDREMIEHFNAHKQEFNALVQSYGEYGAKPLEWSQRPEVLDLKAKTGVWDIGTGGHTWFDDPYSLEAAKKISQMIAERSFAQNHSRAEVNIKMANRKTHTATYLLTGLNWKDYYYFPIDPVIENKNIKLPRRLYGVGIPDLSWRVVDSTDFVSPWNWKRGWCVMRKIEPKWYIKRCRMG